MRALRILVIGALSAAIIVILAIFAVDNLQRVPAHFLGNNFSLNLWWVAIGSALLSFMLAVLLLVPGRVVASWRARSLSRQYGWIEEELKALRAEHERVQAEYGAQQDEHSMLRARYTRLQAESAQLRTERDQLRARLGMVSQAVSGDLPTRPSNPTGTETLASTGQPDARGDGRVKEELNTLRAEHERLRVAYGTLHAHHARLQAESERLRTERDQLHTRLTTVSDVVSKGRIEQPDGRPHGRGEDQRTGTLRS